MRASISIVGLNEYTDGDVWSELTVPEGIDGDLVILNIMAECAELELLYPNPYYMTGLIGVWSASEAEIWRKLYATTQLEYNPIWNKDGTVTETETRHNIHSRFENEAVDDTGSVITSDQGEDNEQFNSEGSSSRGQTNEGDQTTQVSAYDSTGYNNREKVTTTADATEHVVSDNENKTARDDSRNVATADDRHSDRDNDQDEATSDDRVYERKEQGNIGVTTTQQLIREERDVDKFNIYDYIVESFKRRFCLCVY